MKWYRFVADLRKPAGKFLRQQNKFRFAVASLMLDCRPPVLEVTADGPATALFAYMGRPCFLDTLHLTGTTAMYEVLLHYILQHSNMFPYLKFIYFHHHDWESTYGRKVIADIPTQFNPPLSQTDSERRILITVDDSHSLYWEGPIKPKLSIDWVLSSPSKSLVLNF